MAFRPTHIFETHVSVKDRKVSAEFYQRVLNCEPALEIENRDVTFLWMNGKGRSMIGLWGPRCPNPPITQQVAHFAMTLSPKEVEDSVHQLSAMGIAPLDLDGHPIDEAIVIGWMPAISVYFKDPDGHSLEFICMLEEAPRLEVGTVKLSEWRKKI